jgi:hypothetical protein
VVDTGVYSHTGTVGSLRREDFYLLADFLAVIQLRDLTRSEPKETLPDP